MSSTDDLKDLSATKAVLAVMPDPPGEVTPKRLAELTGKPAENIRNAVRRLAKKGKIVETDSPGGYRLPLDVERVKATNRPVFSAEDQGRVAETTMAYGGARAFIVGLGSEGVPSVAFDMNTAQWVQVGPYPVVESSVQPV